MKLLGNLYFQIFVVFVIYFFIFSTILYGVYIGDELAYLTGGALISKGCVYYKDFADNKLPGIYLFTAILELLFGQNYLVLRTIVFVINLFSSYIFAKLTEKSGIDFRIRFWFAFFLLFTVSSIPFLLTETLALPFLLLAFYFLDKDRLELSGFMFGLSGFFRTTIYLYFALFFLAFLIYNSKNRIKKLKLLFGFLVFIYLLLLFFLLQGIDTNMLILSNSGFLKTIFWYYLDVVSFGDLLIYFVSKLLFILILLKVVYESFNHFSNWEKALSIALPGIALFVSFLGILIQNHYFAIFILLTFMLMFRSHKKSGLLSTPSITIVLILFYLILFVLQDFETIKSEYYLHLYFDFLKKNMGDHLSTCSGIISTDLHLRYLFGKYTCFKSMALLTHYYGYIYDSNDLHEFIKRGGCMVENYDNPFLKNEKNKKILEFNYNGEPRVVYIYSK